MKNHYLRLMILVAATLSAGVATAQKLDTLLAVKDGNSTLTRMSLHRNGAFWLGGDYDGGPVPDGFPVIGNGARVLWYPDKAAVRAGFVSGTQWDQPNIGNYSVAMGYDVRASADYGVAFGNRCVASQITAFAMGDNCVASGAASVALGYQANTNARQGSFVFADRSSVDAILAGVNHSANWRVSGGFRIFTSSNLTTGVTFQSGASISNWGQSNAVIATSTGAFLSTGGVWQNASDVHKKHSFMPVSGEDILTKLRALPISSWSYKTDATGIRHIGPMAQDFYKTFGLGSDEKSIGTVDADGIALAGVKALDTRTQGLNDRVSELQAENALLRARLDALEQKESGFPLWPAVAFLGGGAVLLLGWQVLSRRRIHVALG
ncbi:tail fiber domain-containing protein [Siphonobacter aquaeclarae]|uniref:Head domain of trimeric autotransporter adhesin n=1 Tax=Siphonobacter aquaeclarae TaxID=563176 RepID=A0A1G9T310_9BACT|nr:tail fiber domain-containing protein [Siphonobacter aquaeclarae]SDM42016.1 Head domain of trimeric autotransporter adhesin [Siphonobacter aquaeclarae]